MNYLALIITLVLAFVYLLLGGEKKEPKGSSSFLHHDYFGLESLVRTSQNFLGLKAQAGLGLESFQDFQFQVGHSNQSFGSME